MTKATYSVDIHLSGIEDFLSRQERDMSEMGGTFSLIPDFQRGHVWNDIQRQRYIEELLRGTAPYRILFNCPGWTRTQGDEGDIPDHTFVCIDGLQRLTAVRKFMAGEFTIFNGLSAEALKGSPFDPGRYRINASVFEFTARADLLNFYIDLNGAGTPHSEEELDRVRALRDQATQR